MIPGRNDDVTGYWWHLVVIISSLVSADVLCLHKERQALLVFREFFEMLISFKIGVLLVFLLLLWRRMNEPTSSHPHP